MVTVDLSNKDVQDYINKVLSYPKTDYRSPWVFIPRDQLDQYRFAKAYEELNPIISDHIYDMYTRYLQRQKIMFPDIWVACSLACFKDGSWEYTGMFIHDHDPDDEEWII